MMRIEYVDRVSGRVEEERIYGRWALSLLYGESLPARIFSFFFLPVIARISWISRWYGYLQQKPASKRKIAPFIAEFQIDTTEFAEKNFLCFNDFFIRKLKKEKRPIVGDENVAVMPADGRYLVFPNLTRSDRFYVKGQTFDLSSFLCDASLAKRFENGAMVIARLCPTDYHRFHFPCEGTPSLAKEIPGPLFSVNPIALQKKLSILSENKRMVTEIQTKHFGSMLFAEVGATCVGSIHQTFNAEKEVKKGDEKGFFSFGGSCVLLFFEEGKIFFDEDLIANSQKGLETKCLFGTSLGRKERSKEQIGQL
ncbi:MAG: phosphatidylserine decarboxylase [Chlamydiia bacterium]|nr:phosphatidylserine decarboxylase [Chlamydiia bacterium]